MDEKKKFPIQFEETQWLYPLINKGEIGLDELASEAARDLGVDASTIKGTFELYNTIVMEHLKEGHRVEYMGMGTLIPELDENGDLISYTFEVSEAFQKRLDDNFRSNPSLN